jgi:hypothetical protein
LSTVNPENNRFRFILDTVPEWWKQLNNVRIDVMACVAILPSGEAVIAGDWIFREPDGRVGTEANEEGRVEARAFLIAERQQIEQELERSGAQLAATRKAPETDCGLHNVHRLRGAWFRVYLSKTTTIVKTRVSRAEAPARQNP